MNRRRGLKRIAKAKVVNRESSESDNERNDLLEILLSLKKTTKRKQKKRVRKSKKTSSNFNSINNSFYVNDHHSCCKETVSNKRKCTPSKTSTSAVNLESDEEINDNLDASHLRNIENRIDSFFKSGNLVSDDEGDEDSKLNFTSEANENQKKPKDFYMVISDSEDETAANKPSTSADHKILIDDTSKGMIMVDKNQEELMNLVDNILQPDQEQHISKPDDSWDEYKKRTDEILGSVSNLIHGLNGLKGNDNKMEDYSPVEKKSTKETIPSCPICLETLGVKEAASTVCGHMFCKICITHVAKSTKKCPTCRKGLNLKKIHPVYF